MDLDSGIDDQNTGKRDCLVLRGSYIEKRSISVLTISSVRDAIVSGKSVCLQFQLFCKKRSRDWMYDVVKVIIERKQITTK